MSNAPGHGHPSRPTRLLYVSNSARGEYTGRLRWLEALRARGYEVAFAVPTGEDWHARRIADTGAGVHTYSVDVHGIDPWRELRSARQLASIFRRARPDVVHAFGHKANVHCIVAGQRVRRPALILHVAGLGSPFSPGPGPGGHWLRDLLRLAYRLGRRRADRVLFMNADDRDAFGFVPSWQSDVCSSGVDVGEFAPERVPPRAALALRRELDLAQDDVVLTFVARMLPEKGLAELIAALDALVSSHPRLTLLVVGAEEPGGLRLADAVRASVHAAPRIRLLGRREDVRDILAVTDVFVNPSYYREGLPRVNLEAAAMGVPLITTDVPGCRELPRQTPCGVLVPPRSVDALRRAIADLAEDPERRSRLGRAGRQLVIDRYSVTTVVERLDALYRSLLPEPTS